MFSKLTLSYHHLDVKCWHKTRAADVASSETLERHHQGTGHNNGCQHRQIMAYFLNQVPLFSFSIKVCRALALAAHC
jgi:hypothetical protein